MSCSMMDAGGSVGGYQGSNCFLTKGPDANAQSLIIIQLYNIIYFGEFHLTPNIRENLVLKHF